MTLRNILLHSEFSNKTLDLKCVTLSIILRWKEFAICTSPIIHLVLLHPPLPHPLNKNFASPLFLISSGHHSFPRRNWKECLCKVLGANKVYYPWEDVKIGDHPLVPKVQSRFQIWWWPAGLKIRTVMSPSKTRRLWEEVAEASCYN